MVSRLEDTVCSSFRKKSAKCIVAVILFLSTVPPCPFPSFCAFDWLLCACVLYASSQSPVSLWCCQCYGKFAETKDVAKITVKISHYHHCFAAALVLKVTAPTAAGITAPISKQNVSPFLSCFCAKSQHHHLNPCSLADCTRCNSICS